MQLKSGTSLYDKIHYDGNIVSVKTITRDELLSLNRESVDHFLSIDLGIWAFRNSKGKWVEKKLSEKSMGTTCLRIIECLQCEPGIFYTPNEISELTNIYSLKNPNNLSARLRVIRLCHEETFEEPNFFLSKRAGGFGAAWNPKKTFTQIVRIKGN
ncbi:MAG: hypothetical protein WC770_04530 [Phycisphaerae bacterium]|jgi:hypothetical protein